ncbi:MAG: ATP-binding protein [Rhizobiaceae bacterium]
MRRGWRRSMRFLARSMPTGLFGRSLIIIITPMLILQGVIAFVFLERHWQSVTNRLSAAVVRDIAGLVDVIETYPQDTDYETITRIAQERLSLNINILPLKDFPPLTKKPFFSILDTALSKQMALQLNKPFWIDTVGNSKLLELRIRLEKRVLRVFVRRNRAYASNTSIFMLWMVGASLVLITIAILFLRNQIRPIQRLAEAAERFGKGQDIPHDFKPAGATEVRRATLSFIEMRNRIERAVEQRTAMLAGVSHDLRTVLTRFRLQLALVPASREVEALSGDIDDMQGMLQGYLDFARGDAGEPAEVINLRDTLERFHQQAQNLGKEFSVVFDGESDVEVRPNAFNRLMVNLIMNGFRHAKRVEVRGYHLNRSLRLEVHDNGKGIAEEDYPEVFKPFVRLDDARNQDESGTGLGLAIVQDIVHMHGGEIELGRSDLGGLLVTMKLPV